MRDTKTVTGKVSEVRVGDDDEGGKNNNAGGEKSDRVTPDGRRVRELRRSVWEALTPRRGWSDSEDFDYDKRQRDKPGSLSYMTH